MLQSSNIRKYFHSQHIPIELHVFWNLRHVILYVIPFCDVKMLFHTSTDVAAAVVFSEQLLLFGLLLDVSSHVSVKVVEGEESRVALVTSE